MSHTYETPKAPPYPSSGMGNVTFIRPGTPVEIDPNGGGSSFHSQPHKSEFTAAYGRSYSHRSNGETHHLPSSSGPFIFGILNMIDSFSSSVVNLGVGPC